MFLGEPLEADAVSGTRRPRGSRGPSATVESAAARAVLLAEQVADETLADANRLAGGLLAAAERRAQETIEGAKRSAAQIMGQARGAAAEATRTQHAELLAAFTDSRRELHALVEASLQRIESRADELAADRRAHDRAEDSLDHLLRALAEERSRGRPGGAPTGAGRQAGARRARAAHPARAFPSETPAPARHPTRCLAPGWCRHPIAAAAGPHASRADVPASGGTPPSRATTHEGGTGDRAGDIAPRTGGHGGGNP